MENADARSRESLYLPLTGSTTMWSVAAPAIVENSLDRGVRARGSIQVLEDVVAVGALVVDPLLLDRQVVWIAAPWTVSTQVRNDQGVPARLVAGDHAEGRSSKLVPRHQLVSKAYFHPVTGEAAIPCIRHDAGRSFDQSCHLLDPV